MLTPDERKILLREARRALEAAVKGQSLPSLDSEALPERLITPGATFVTLTKQGELRGCIGAMEASVPLVEDVRLHAIAAALQDYRFPPVTPEELDDIRIEISYLTPLQKVNYGDPQDLIDRLRPRIDGVLLRDGIQRATFLPQVWEKIPQPDLFLSYLCQKMGADSDLWRQKKLDVYTYQVEEFHE